MFCGVCISTVTSVCGVYLSSFKLFCIFWCLLWKTLEYMKLFKNQIQVLQNTKKKTCFGNLKWITFTVEC